jgi:tetratricopeptide (TPR) repeat protein
MSDCALCKKHSSEGPAEPSRSEDGQTAGGLGGKLWAVAETSLGQFEICEACYEQGLPVFFTQSDLAEIHYQFGLEYLERDQSAESIDALSQALRINESADTLAALGNAESRRGDQASAIAHYQRALELDPSNPTAKENLKGLQSQAA